MFILVSLLKGFCFFNQLINSYDEIKTAILSRYELTAEAYREKFRNSSQLSDESFKEFAVRLVGFLRHWLEREEMGNDFAKFADLFAREQLMVSCSKELKLWIKEQKPKTVDELIEKAEAFQQAHKNEHVSKPDQPKHPGKSRYIIVINLTFNNIKSMHLYFIAITRNTW
jgi:hypothetical protein